MTDITTSDDNCVDGFIGDAECVSGMFDDDSNTRHWFFESNHISNTVNHAIDNTAATSEAILELDSEISESDALYNNIDEANVSEKRAKSRKVVKLKNEALSLKCGWNNCEFEEVHIEKFVRHIDSHVIEMCNTTVEDYTCSWQSCDFNSSVVEEVKCHVNYHAYHTKLKSIGQNVKARTDLPDCLYGYSNSNQIPDVLDPYRCNWSDCTYEGSCIQTFLFHVLSHVVGSDNYKCLWKGCGNSFANVSKLNCHVRVHTKEKVVACPDCGGMFASNTKYIDHCKRQLTVDLQGYQCAHCFKHYSSERILRDHMRSHINVHKCTFCDMTCANKFTLATHIRFRHLKLRPFNCTSCDYRCETKQDLVNHLSTHYEKFRLICEERGCNFTCRSQQAMKKHILQKHEGASIRIYECHDCGKQFARGAQLTKHLKSRHNLRWPSGHKRFSYRPDEDGKYKLQRIRYESLDVTERMASNDVSNMIDEKDTIDNEDDRGFNTDDNSQKVLITIDEEVESGEKLLMVYSSVELIDKIPDGATVLAECCDN